MSARGRFLLMKLALCLLMTGVASFFIRHLPVEEDVVASIERSRPEAATLFHRLKASGLFQDRVFIKMLHPDPALAAKARETLADLGYAPLSLQAAPTIDTDSLYAMLGFLPRDRIEFLLSAAHRKEILGKVQAALTMPGGLAFLRMLERDPLLLGQELQRLFPLGGGGEDVLIAAREGPIDFAKVERLYDFLKSGDRNWIYLAGDLFALENRDVVQRDILICTLLSLVIGLLIFRFFCRQWSVLVLLFVGTAFSSMLGLLAVRIFDHMAYGLVLAFASTFVSFNNEALVHLAGVNLRASPRTIVAMASAIGTTILGFLVLLASSLDMARQMAILSLASLLGFLLFLSFFTREVQGIALRTVALPQLRWKKARTLIGAGCLLLSIILLPKPAFHTDLTAFRYASPYLDRMVERFSGSFNRLDLQRLRAVPVSENPKEAFDHWDGAGYLEGEVFHPLRLYRSLTEQRSRFPALDDRLAEARLELEVALRQAGVRPLLPPLHVPRNGLTSLDYLKLWNQMSPLPFLMEYQGRHYLTVFGDHFPKALGAVPLHPKLFYEGLLQELSEEIGRLFLWGILAMLLYLLPWHRDLQRICLIFIPLLAAALVLQLFFLATGRTINIVHIMGASLVIAVALDYSALLVTHDHGGHEQGKVVLTGGLTLSAFASLLLASHPVLRELGLLVTIGTGISLLFALFNRQAPEEDA